MQQVRRILTGAMGGEEISRGGKCGPGFYRALLQRAEATPESTVMVGDDLEADLAFAREAGISQVIIIDRTQDEDWKVFEDGARFVNSLEFALDAFSG
ncbi:unnamed protein product [marine sediment metagenome]|uniref:Uncharacterized protein n=1 Tax=marine sediment metagenome TaxID=412755 RepID=X0SWF8_9ZZZZ